MMGWTSAVRLGVTVALCLLIGGCVGQSTSRLGMVRDPATGLQIGSVVERTVVTDASFHRNRRIKVRIRNTSGDPAFDLHAFAERLRAAYAASGYEPTEEDDFGLLVDMNVMYSGQVQSNLATEYALLGAAGGAVTGAAMSGDRIGLAAGGLAGASFGSILGSFATEDTYVVVAHVTFATISEPLPESSKTITFSRSPRTGDKDEDVRRRREEERSARGIRKTFSSDVSVFAGGTNVPQSRIADDVRERLVRIVSEFI